MTLKINGATGGSVSIDAPDNTSPAGTDVTLTLPTTAGAANQVLKNSGTAGTLEYGVALPSGNGTSGQYLQTAGDGTTSWQTVEGLPDAIDVNASAPADSVNIDSSGRLLVGLTTGNNRNLLQIQGDVDNGANGVGGISLRRGVALGSIGNGSQLGQLDFCMSDGGVAARIICDAEGSAGTGDYPGRLEFYTTADGAASPTERMRISQDGGIRMLQNGGSLLVNTTTTLSAHKVGIAGNSQSVMYLDRKGNDGNLLTFFRDASEVGVISVASGTVSYGGGHISRWSQLPNNAERTEILMGSVLSNLDEMCVWAYDAEPEVLWKEGDELPEGVQVGDVKTPARPAGTEDNIQLNRMKVSDVEGDPNVAGVFQNWDDDDDTYTNDFFCAMTGDFVIRIAQGVTVERGDLLMSAGDGTAKPQEDDIIRSKTIAKVTSTNVSCTYDDGSYCVPCVLMAC